MADSVVHKQSRPIQRIQLDGEYDLSRKEELVAVLGSLSAKGPAVVDMTTVTYVDSTFLRELAGLQIRFKRWGVTLVGVSAAIKRILEITSFDQLFRIVDQSLPKMCDAGRRWGTPP